MSFATRPDLTGSFGMVSSTHWLASASGMAMLEAGGSAVDAAVAAAFVLQVVEPHLNGPGGDLVLLISERGGDPVVLGGQGPAPAAASIDAYRARGHAVVPGTGLLAAAVPGSVVAWLTLLRDSGTATVGQVLSYAVHYAEHGYPVLPSMARTIGAVADLLRTEWLPSAEVYLPGDRVPVAGEVLTNPVLASTYRRLVAAAAGVTGREAAVDAVIDAWTTGFVAEAVDDFCRTPWRDTSGQRSTGVLTGQDLAAWRPGYEPAVTTTLGAWTVAKAPAWTQGPAFLQQLRLLDGTDLRPGGADFVHTVVEAAKLAFADRDAWYGDDPDVPLVELLGAPYTEARRALLTDTASYELRPGSPAGRTPRLPDFTAAPAVSAAGTGEPTVARSGENRGDTCHVAVADRWGTMVAATPSGGWLQSSPVIPALGFPLGTRLQMTTLEPGLPASLTPGRRPRTTLSPTIVSRDGRPQLAFGTPGGDQQDQWQLNFFLQLAFSEDGADLQRVVDAPMFHTTHFPSSFFPREASPGQIVVEERFGPGVVAELRRRGHQVVLSAPWSLGRLCVVGRDPSGRLRAASDPRGRQGYAVGR
ncbi:gamma-glutamyltransferase family protein [Nakamurella deserti]|uniref:gamma-glutamyltransferase family protein n=1 Tax=Nakamurella deserti TaxID=2164074 RepID=UPI000DBE6180|nr:gamma-glutamyltransferase [Nakamurella deserti]